MAQRNVPGTAQVKCIDRLSTTVPEGILQAVRVRRSADCWEWCLHCVGGVSSRVMASLGPAISTVDISTCSPPRVRPSTVCGLEHWFSSILPSFPSIHPSITRPQVRDNDADMLVLGISGYGNRKLGSVSEDISVHASCTTLIIKDSYEVRVNKGTVHTCGWAPLMVLKHCRAWEREVRYRSIASVALPVRLWIRSHATSHVRVSQSGLCSSAVAGAVQSVQGWRVIVGKGAAA